MLHYGSVVISSTKFIITTAEGFSARTEFLGLAWGTRLLVLLAPLTDNNCVWVS